jgi:YD repeat-containing protein
MKMANRVSANVTVWVRGALQILAWLVSVIGSSLAWGQSNDLRNYHPNQLTMSPKGVNLQTGRWTYAKTDLSIGNLSLVRSWGDVSSFKYAGNIFGSSATTLSYARGWGHNYSGGVIPDNNGGNYLLVSADSKRYKFATVSGGSIIPWDRAAKGALLEATPGGYVFTNQSGTVYTFTTISTITVLTRADYPDGSRIDYSFSATVKPRLIASNRGYAIILDYDANGNVSMACGFNTAVQFVSINSTCAGAALKVTYGYSTDSSQLTSVTDTLGRVFQYIGYATGGPLCITFANSTTCELQNAYGPQPGDIPLHGTKADMVRVQTTANGDIWRYDYELAENALDVPPVQGRPRYTYSTMIDPAGAESSFAYDRGALVDESTPMGTYNYKYPEQVFTLATPFSLSPATVDYHASVPSYLTMAEGDMEYFLYNNRGNTLLHAKWPKGAPTPVSAVSGSYIISQTDPDLARCCVSPDTPVMPPGSISVGQAFMADYPGGSNFVTGCGAGPADAKRCDKPIAVIDARGNQTDYTYDPAHGGVSTETAPAVNGIRAQTRYTYAQRSAWIKTSTGTFIQTSPPVWVMTQKSICKAGAALSAGCATAGDEVITIYDYGANSGPNNLLLRGMVVDSTGLALRTCYSYDGQDNKISETKPRAGLASCP